LEAGDTQEALRQLPDNDRKIDLLITDVCLPAGSGIQVAVTLRTYIPGLSVILASNHPWGMWKPRDYALLGRLGPDSVSILRKPLGPQALLMEIATLIGDGQSEAARTA
jgi:CheY-like chemotaxis protein